MFIGGRGDVILRVTFLTGGGDLWGGRTCFLCVGGSSSSETRLVGSVFS